MNKVMCASALAAVIALSANGAHAAAAADPEVSALKAQIAKLANKVDQMEKQAKKSEKAAKAAPAASPAPVAAAPAAPAVAAAPAADLSAGLFPGSFKIPGTETSVKLGGYIKLDAIGDIGEGYGASFAKFYAIPLKNDPRTQQSSQTTFTAQQTRLNIETRTPSSWGEIKTFVEGDFYNGTLASNGNTSNYGFQLRHAYGSVGSAASGQVLAGQTYTNFMDVAAMPESLDYLGPAGTMLVRQPQVRYTQAFGALTLSGSVEVGAAATQATGASGATYSTFTSSSTSVTGGNLTRTQMPDLVANAKYDYASNGYVGLRALVNQINVDRTVATTNNDVVTKYGYGVALSGSQGTIGKDKFNYNFAVGKGTGRYMYDISSMGAYYNTTTNSLKTTAYYGGTMGYQHFWTDQLRSTLSAGAVRQDNNTAFLGTAAGSVNKYVASGHANLIWQPTPSYKVGIEYMRGYRKIQSGVEGSLNRTQASFIYNF